MTKREMKQLAEQIFYHQLDASEDSDFEVYQDYISPTDDEKETDQIDRYLVVVAAKYYAKLAGGKFIPKGKK